MTAPLRWLLVALLAVAVAAPPVVLRLLPASGSSLSAAELADRARAGSGIGWSGEVRTVGGLALPDVGSFANVANLLGESSDLRVWWRSGTQWRVDRVRGSGETDLVRNGGLLLRWTYESHRAVATRYSSVRLPDESDLLPSRLAAQVLDGAPDHELTRLGARRVAGRTAAGLRLVPRDERSTIGHVDLWVDEASGLPLRVRIFARNSRVPVLSSELTSVHIGVPAAGTTRFGYPQGVPVDSSFAADDVAGANAFAPFLMPDELAGLPRRGELGAVGVYGSSVTRVVAIPLRRHIAHQLFEQLRKSKASRLDSQGISLALGPLSVREAADDRGVFLLAGTITPAALISASGELLTGVGVEGRR